MKTTYLQKTYRTCAKGTRIIITLIGKEIAAVMASMLIVSSGIAQEAGHKPHLSIGISAQVNANGYGSAYLPTVGLSTGRTAIALSPIIQKRELNLAGAQLGCQYALTGEPVNGEGGPELFLLWQGAYHANALMGRGALRNEYSANRLTSEERVKELRFQSAEMFAGVGLRVTLVQNLKWVNSVAIGGNTCFNFPCHENLYYSGKNFGLNLATGLTYAIR